MKTITEAMKTNEYLEAKRKVESYQKAFEEEAIKRGCKPNGWKSLPSEIAETLPYANEVNNDLRTQIEVYEFINEKPEKYFLYVNEKTGNAITWTGAILGKITFGHSWRSTFGDTRQSIKVVAINGLTYSGTYFKSSGNYARIKKVKQ